MRLREVVQSRGGRRDLLAQLSRPLGTFLRTESGSAGILLGAALVALAWANSPWSHAYEALWSAPVSLGLGDLVVASDLEHLVNDGLMAVFFFVIGLEVRREFSMGELTDRRRALLPLAAGLGGMIVPTVIYLAVVGGGPAAGGWGIVIGTDTAFLLGALALVGPRFSTQLRIFLLTLTVIDDIVAVTVIGVAYSGSVRLLPLAGLVVVAGLLVLLGRADAWRTAPYVVLVLLLWFCTVEAGLHGAIAGMLGGLLIAAHPPAREVVETAATRFRAFRQSPMVGVGRTARQSVARAISVNERLQAVLHPWASFVVVPLFALANAGVDLRGGVLAEALAASLTWAVVAGLVLGKLVGIAGSTALGIRFRLGRLPQGVASGHILGGAALSGVGFTVSLLIAGLAFEPGPRRDQATVGVLLAAVLATGLGALLFWAAARFRGQRDADLPRVLDRPVDPAVDHVRGRADAPLTLVEYGDFECPFCAKTTGVLRELADRFGDELRYVFRHLPLTDVHPHAELAARAAEAAGAQGRFWEMHDRLFAHQDQLEYEDLAGYAAALGLDVEEFLRALDDEDTVARIRADVASAEASGARGTPTFFVGERRHVGPHDTETLAAALAGARSAVRAVGA
jgi:Na+/H+ antiporter NhaA